MTLSTRKPTGEAGWPSLIVEGKEGAGKTYASLRLSADPRIGRTYVVEVGEHRADEYAALGDFDIVEHDDRLGSITDALVDVMSLPPEGGRPTVLVLDSGTALWDLVKREAERIARQSKSAKQRLAQDPDAEIEVGHQAWNKATDRHWWKWLDVARTWQGILLITARADEVAKFVDGKPVPNQHEYRVDIQKGTPFAVDGTVRCRVGQPPLLTTAKSLRIEVPADGVKLPRDDTLAHVLFDVLGAGEVVTLNVARAKSSLVAYARALGLTAQEATDIAAAAWAKHAGHETAFDGELMAKLTDAVEIEVGNLPAPEEAAS